MWSSDKIIKDPGLHEVCILVEREKQQIKKSTDIMLENNNTMGESDREKVKDAGDEGCHFQ